MNDFNLPDSRLEEIVSSRDKASPHASNFVSASPACFPRKLESIPDSKSFSASFLPATLLSKNSF